MKPSNFDRWITTDTYSERVQAEAEFNDTTRAYCGKCQKFHNGNCGKEGA